MTDETLADLMRRAGLRPAWQGTREARPGYQQQQSPAGALADPRTVPYRRVPTRRDREFSRAALADTMQRGAFAEPRNQFAEAGMNALETTGAPEIARGVRSIQANEPGQAAGHFALGGLGLLGTASLPFGGGARSAPPRVPRIQRGIEREETLSSIGRDFSLEQSRLPNAPPRLPTRATDGSILPLRPPEPMRQSLVGGSDDLADAARMRPDGDQLTQMIARRDALAAEQRQLEESLAPTPASDRRAEMLNAQVRELETEIERLGGSARTQDMGRARSATYEPSDGVEMGIAPSGAVEFTYNGRATPGGGSAADAQRVFRGVYRALQEDISAFGRETYRWRPETPRQADLYRAAMARRAPEGYRFSENADGTMQLDRARPPPMFPGGRNR